MNPKRCPIPATLKKMNTPTKTSILKVETSPMMLCHLLTVTEISLICIAVLK